MRLIPSDPDVETVIARIEAGDLDLQPEFQRGEVWSKAKKQRLIDSILRDWHIPPIHVIELRDSRRQEVLDGQQRLAAIRDFIHGEFPVDGTIEPLDKDIKSLNGQKFRDLPEEWKRRINQFTLRIFRLVDYKPDEPGELFFRLNQPTSLTAAEQRNAFFGPTRTQIKSLVSDLEASGLDRGILGFSNARMAYDDVMARVALTVKRNSLSQKITAADLIEIYRSEQPLPSSVLEKIKGAISIFSSARADLTDYIQLNKATVYSWFLFLIRASTLDPSFGETQLFGRYLKWFEEQRGDALLSELRSGDISSTQRLIYRLLTIYSDRSASRVADVSSVLLRDATIWTLLIYFPPAKEASKLLNGKTEALRRTLEQAPETHLDDETLAKKLLQAGWGVFL